MNGMLINFCVIYSLIAAFAVVHPWLSRKNVLFGVVFGGVQIRANPGTKKILRRFIAWSAVIAAALAVPCILFFLIPAKSDADTALVFTVAVLVLVGAEGVPFIAANRAMKALKETIHDPNLVSDSITVELGADAEKDKKTFSGAWFLLLMVPIAISVVLIAVFYPSMPDTIATHYNAAGAADAWQAKSAGVLVFPITMQVVLAAVFFLIGIFMRNAPSAVKGSPGAAPGYGAFRRFLNGWLIGFGLLVQANFIIIILLYAGWGMDMGAWITVFLALTIASVAILFAAFFRMRQRGPEGKVYDDDSRWKAGMFYYNPSDPSIFVEKRTGIGQTLNFGHPAAWVIIGAIAAVVVFSLVISLGK